MNGRRLRGTITATSTGYSVGVPRARGAKARVSHTFDTWEQAETWRALAVQALLAGAPLPARTEVIETGPPVGTPEGPATHGTDFATAAASWIDEKYARLHRGDLDRKNQVTAIVANHLLPFLAEQAIHSGSELTREAYLDFLTAMVGPPPASARPVIAAGDYTIEQAACVCGVSVSTIKRRRKNGHLPSSYIDAHGTRRIPHTDLVTANLTAARTRGRPIKRHGLAVGTAKHVRTVLDEVLAHGRDKFGWVLSFDPAGIENPLLQRAPKAARTQISFAETAAMAAHLHVVFQLALWLMRVCGLRISEAYGIRVEDVILDGTRGVIRVHRQGGRTFAVYNGDAPARVASKDITKTEQSVRALIIPAQLATLIRIVIEVFHTDPDTGHVDPHRRLIPGLATDNVGGQSAFRAALSAAAQAAGVRVAADLTDSLLPMTPHDLRKGNLTDLAWADIDPLVRKRWGGHAAGSDVAHRTYVLDHPDLRPFVAAAKELESLIDAECEGSLTVATTVSCTTGSQPALAAQRDRIDSALLDAGWLIGETAPDGASMVDVADATDLLGGSLTATRRWVAAHPYTDTRGGRHLIPVDSVLAERERREALCTLDLLADDLGVTYNALYFWMERDGLDTDTVDGRIVVPADTEKALRHLHARQVALEQRCLSVTDAATELGVSVHVIDRLIRNGHLACDAERGPRNTRYVTRESVAAAASGMQRKPA